MAEFAPLRAVREEIASVAGVAHALIQLEQRLIAEAERAETELNQVRKVLGFLGTYREFLGNKRSALEAARAE
jgi:hypothetical protein